MTLSNPIISGFFLLGLLNNASYVIMIAGAKSISEGSVALVFLCNVLPSFLCKLTSPVWFHRVEYKKRINACVLLMSASFVVVAVGEDYKLKLLGVCFASLQSGLGEASILALSSLYPSPVLCLTSFSSGTGFAGIFGFAWAVDNQGLDSPRTNAGFSPSSPPPPMTVAERCSFTSSLSKYMFPLFVVYFAEYAMQSGTWAAIGFPVTSSSARADFYTRANWTYQAGVFVSRSSGTVYRPTLLAVQSMPVLQVLLLLFFYFVAYSQSLYSYALLLPPCFLAGLLGGCVYVNAFSLISVSVRPRLRELALATASAADSCGIMAADAAGLLLQACLYEKHGIEGAKVKCF
ncbi:hypothetical protein TrRE_jg11999 [Triparma retinervis]|uniref:Battenin n=1 Tax=Triparma retinervis TaxID=2557542 RepID=A0A9W7F6A4_9STRA|nr:hypothetical protein TrRE_jg11999 [Triparma retinervis]